MRLYGVVGAKLAGRQRAVHLGQCALCRNCASVVPAVLYAARERKRTALGGLEDDHLAFARVRVRPVAERPRRAMWRLVKVFDAGIGPDVRLGWVSLRVRLALDGTKKATHRRAV